MRSWGFSMTSFHPAMAERTGAVVPLGIALSSAAEGRIEWSAHHNIDVGGHLQELGPTSFGAYRKDAVSEP